MAKIDAYQGVRVFLTKKARKDKKNPDAPAEKLSKLGKIHMSVFSPNGRQLVGFLVARPDVAGMVKREDAFLAWDSFEPCERGIVVTRPDDGLGDAARKRLGLDWDKCIMWAGMDARTRSGKVLGYVNDVEFDLKTGRAKTFYIGDGGMARALVGSFKIPAKMVIGYASGKTPDAGFMVVSDEAADLAVDGGAAAKAGEAWAAAKVKGSEFGHKAGKATSEAVDKGSFALGRALGKAKRAIADATAEEPEPANPAELPAVDVTVSAPVEELKAAEAERVAEAKTVTYVPASQKPAGEKREKPAQSARPSGKKPTEAQKAAAKKKAAAASADAARALGKGLGRMGKMFGSFKDEFDKASK